MYTKARERTFKQYPLPQILKTRLDEIILNLKLLQLGESESFFRKLMDPPDPQDVRNSVRLLKNLNALDKWEKLTPLGYHLAQLPMDPRTGS